MKRLIPIMLAFAVLCSCSPDSLIEPFMQTDEISLVQGGNVVFKYDPNTCQISFNRQRKEFRVHNDIMSDFYTLTLYSLPVQKGDTVRGTLIWTTPSDIYAKKNVTFEAVRIEGDKIWLWTGNGRMGVVVRVLD